MTNKTIQLTDRRYEYLIGVSLREPAVLRRLRAETAALPEANMQIAPEQGQFMALLCELGKAGIEFTLADNAFLSIEDPERAQAIAERFDLKVLHRQLHHWARTFCPILKHFRAAYHWSLMQVELSTDVIFRRQPDFQPL